MDIEQKIRQYLPNVLHMSLATCANDKPWVCEVHFVYDEELNVYFRSKLSRRHSQEIATNPNVAGNIIEPHDKTMKPRGVYFEGRAQIVKEPGELLALFQGRLGLGEEIIEDAKQPDGHKVYKITVSDWYLFDARESKPSQK